MNLETSTTLPARRVAQPSSRLYFVGDGSEARALIDRGLTGLYAHMRAVERLQRRLGADAVVQTAKGHIHALAYECEPGDEPERRPGLKFAGRDRNASDLHYHLYQTDKRSAEGQAIAQQAHEIGAFNFSDWVLAELGIPVPAEAARSSGPRLDCSYAGTRKGRLLLSITSASHERCMLAPWLRAVPLSTFTKYSEE